MGSHLKIGLSFGMGLLCSSALAQTYRYREVPLLPGALFGEATGVNDAGLTVGRCTYLAGVSRSWVFDPATGSVTELALPVHRAGNGVWAINNSGVAVGTIESGTQNAGFVLSGVGPGVGGGGLQLLTRDITPAAEQSGAFAVNQSGEIAGRHTFVCGLTTPLGGASWASGSATPTPTLVSGSCGAAESRGMNDAGLACGVAITAFSSPSQTWARPMLWNGTAMTLLSTPSASGRENGYASDINAGGMICGYAEDRTGVGAPIVPCVWNPGGGGGGGGVLSVLGSLVPGPGAAANTSALSLNDEGDVVGFGPFGTGSAAVLWESGTTAPINLNTRLSVALESPKVLARAVSISNAGFIAGRVDLTLGSSRGFVLEPCTPTVTSAPIDQEAGCGADVTLVCGAAGAGPFTFTWKKDGVTVGVGASLLISSFSGANNGVYTCEVVGACGSVTTAGAAVVLRCPADFDGSGGTPDSADIDAFFTPWLAGESIADADCSGGTPDSADIDAFFSVWLAGGC